MARQPDFVDPEYDRRLAEFKALKAKMRQEAQNQSASSNNTRKV